MLDLLRILFAKKEKVHFKKDIDGETTPSVFINGKWIKLPGIWPLVDENFNETPFITIGTKGGIPKIARLFMRKYKNIYKFIYNCQNGPFLIKNYKKIYKDFDGIFDLDYVDKNREKSLFCNHSMMSRSMPYQNFFWEPINENKKFDFDMLTWGNINNECKRWDRGKIICDFLCSKGLNGLIVTQRGLKNDIIDEYTKKHIESNKLEIHEANYSMKDFHNLMCRSKISIFPNTIDAFPKYIIESILADKPVIISSDLLLGRSVLEGLGKDVCLVIDFENDKNYLEKIYKFIIENNFSASPRQAWLEKYNFNKLSEKWAEEINRKFNTNYKKLFYFNHLNRIKNNYENKK